MSTPRAALAVSASGRTRRYRQAAFIVPFDSFNRNLPNMIDAFNQRRFNIGRFSYISLDPNTVHIFFYTHKEGISVGQWERLKTLTNAFHIHYIERPMRCSKIEDEFANHPCFSLDIIRRNEIVIKVIT